MRTLIKFIVILAVLAGLGYGGFVWYAKATAPPAVTFRTAPVKRGELLAAISATGTVEPEEVIDVGAQVAGQINEFGKDVNGKTVDYGSVVDENTTLAEIDTVLYNSDVEVAQAQVDAAKASVVRAQADLGQMEAKRVQAERDWERAQKLGTGEALAQSTYDGYKAAFDTAVANVGVGNAAIVQAQAAQAQATATMKRAKRNLSYCTIKSPVKGVIVDRRVNIGQTVVSSLNAPSLFLIAKDLKRMQVWVSVNEADIGSIQPNQPVTFSVDAFPNRTFKGIVGKVRLNAAMTQNVVTYTVEVLTENSDGKLLPYMTANVQFEVSRKADVLMVPNAALRWSPTDEKMVSAETRAAMVAEAKSAGGGKRRGGDKPADGSAAKPDAGAPASADGATTEHAAPKGGSHRGTIWIKDGELVKPIKVRTGLTDGSNTEVVSGDLAEGAEVIVGEARADAAGDDATNPFAPKFGQRRGGGGGGGR
jgi:HlyD family secretion protein